ncbi:MAG: hypothetical protein OEV78_09485, partial [Spirochaetia bacterium]|nr:hypothetical protein [Spirochaetia bacterium]
MKFLKLFIKMGLVVVLVTGAAISCKSKSSLNNSTGSTTTATVGGRVVGLDVGKSVTLRLNDNPASDLTVAYLTGFDAFTFNTLLSTGDKYDVKIFSQTTTRICTIGGNSGIINNSNIDSVTVSCIIGSGGAAGFTYFPTAGLTTSENGATAGFAVWLNSTPTANVTIGFISSNTAEGTVSPATLTFTPLNWSTPQWVTITGIDDLATPLQDGNILYNIVTTPDTTTTDLSYKNLTPALVAVTNLDNDKAGIYVSPVTGLSVSEVGSATFTVVLTSQPYGTITIPLNSALGGANGEATYSPASLSFDSVCPGATCWSTPHTVTINGVNDAIADGNKVFTITSNAITSTAILPFDSGYAGSQLGVAPMPIVNVTSIDVGAPGFTVTPINTTTSEAGPTTGSFTVVLNTQPTANVIVPVSASASATGEGNIISPFVGSGNLTFTTGACPSVGNWCIPQTVVVSGLDDTPPVADGNKAFTVYVGKDASNTFGTAVSGAVEYVPLNPTDVNFTNLDNETASVVFGISSSSILYTTESAGTPHTSAFDVRLSSAPVSGSVTVNFMMSVAGQATLSTVALPVGAATTSLTFTSANYNIPQTVTITSVDDTLPDGTVAYQVQVSSITGDPTGYNLLALGALVVKVIDFDNDSSGVTYTQVTGPSFNEAGGTATFTAQLKSSLQTGKIVQIDFNAIASGGRATVTPSVTFNDALCPGVGCWNVPQTITVTGVDNTIVDGDLNFFLTSSINAATTDTNYASLGVLQSVNGTVVDNEVAGFSVSACGGGTTTEGGVPPANQCTFNVSLSQDPGLGNTVTVPMYS